MLNVSRWNRFICCGFLKRAMFRAVVIGQYDQGGANGAQPEAKTDVLSVSQPELVKRVVERIALPAAGAQVAVKRFG